MVRRQRGTLGKRRVAMPNRSGKFLSAANTTSVSWPPGLARRGIVITARPAASVRTGSRITRACEGPPTSPGASPNASPSCVLERSVARAGKARRVLAKGPADATFVPVPPTSATWNRLARRAVPGDGMLRKNRVHRRAEITALGPPTSTTRLAPTPCPCSSSTRTSNRCTSPASLGTPRPRARTAPGARGDLVRTGFIRTRRGA